MIKSLRIMAILLLLCLPVHAVDGEVYFGMFNRATTTSRAYPDGGVREYISGIKIGQEINRFRPYLQIETLIDEYVGNGTFHPGSVRYKVGIDINIWDGIYFGAEHDCWHPVDREGTVEEYNLFTIKYRFKQ